ncbi:MAG TPA: hypothetical protein VNV37_00555 [Solirubrobacteraceae bacterium]|jgi:hypothetical protein|nr:hypothetical protein [Solirubrobacteraceae bacterium]
MRIERVLAGGLALIAIAVVVTLAHSPLVVVRRGPPPELPLVSTTQAAAACQSGEALPHGTTAIRLSLTAALGPRVAVRVLSGARVVTRGTAPAGWSDASVTVPVQPLPRTLAPVKVCFATSYMNGKISMRGVHTAPAEAVRSHEGPPLPGRMDIEYLRPGGSSWWSQVGAIARRLGLGRAASGTGNALLVLALLAALVSLSSWLVVRELR